jgi:hypothetical protein
MLLFDVGIHVAGIDPTQKVYIFIRVKLGHFAFCSRLGTLFMCRFLHQGVLCEGGQIKQALKEGTHENFHLLV